VAVKPSLFELNEPSDALIAVPAPLAPIESMKNSAAAMVEVAVPESVAVEVIVGPPLAGFGDMAGALAVGSVVSILILNARSISCPEPSSNEHVTVVSIAVKVVPDKGAHDT
jgi:hypothetical protein